MPPQVAAPQQQLAVLDASVIFPQILRGLLLWIAAAGAFDPRWSPRILDEVRVNLLTDARMTQEQWDRFASSLERAFPDAEQPQPAIDALIAGMTNDEKDRHVLAAAVHSDVHALVTNNLKHFASRHLSPVGIRGLSGGDFLCELLERAPRIVREALDRQAATMRRPRQWTAAEVLGALVEADPPAARFVAEVERRLRIAPSPPPERR